MRNLVLSAYPRLMRLPDPFTPNLKVDVLPEIAQPPRLLGNHVAALAAAEGGALLVDLNMYLNQVCARACRAPMVTFLCAARTGVVSGHDRVARASRRRHGARHGAHQLAVAARRRAGDRGAAEQGRVECGDRTNSAPRRVSGLVCTMCWQCCDVACAVSD
jgi:hypothetical protein